MGASTAYRSSKAGSYKASAASKPDTIYSFNQPESAASQTVLYLTQHKLDEFSQRMQDSTLGPEHKAGANILDYMLKTETPRGKLSECEDAPFFILEPKPATGRMSHGVSTPASSVFGLSKPSTKKGSGMKSKKSFVRFADTTLDEASINAFNTAWKSIQSKRKKTPRAGVKSTVTKKCDMATIAKKLDAIESSLKTWTEPQLGQHQDPSAGTDLEKEFGQAFGQQSDQSYDTGSNQGYAPPAPPSYAVYSATDGQPIQYYPDPTNALPTQSQGYWQYCPLGTQAAGNMYETYEPSVYAYDPVRHAMYSDMSNGAFGSFSEPVYAQ